MTALLWFRTIGLAAGWALFAFVAYKAATTVIDEPDLWNPYDILGVSEVNF